MLFVIKRTQVHRGCKLHCTQGRSVGHQLTFMKSIEKQIQHSVGKGMWSWHHASQMTFEMWCEEKWLHPGPDWALESDGTGDDHSLPCYVGRARLLLLTQRSWCPSRAGSMTSYRKQALKVAPLLLCSQAKIVLFSVAFFISLIISNGGKARPWANTPLETQRRRRLGKKEPRSGKDKGE